MALTIIVDGQKIAKPGAYGTPKVELTAGFVPVDQGIVGFVGESDSGFDGATDGIQEFTSAQVSDIQEKYVSGEIVEASRAAVQPGRGEIVNGAGFLKIYKTNNSTAATGAIKNIDDANSGDGDTTFNVKSKNAGARESFINYKISEGSAVDAQPAVTSEAITFPLTFTDTDTLTVDINGTTYTFTASVGNGNLGPHADVSALVTVLNTAASWSASDKPVIASAGSATNTIVLTMDESNTGLDGYESQLEYGIMSIGGTGTLPTQVAMTTASTINADLTVTPGSAGPVRGERGGRIFVINRNDFTETIPENDNAEIMTIRYIGTGTSCSMSIQETSGVKRLTTTCAGAATDDLDLNLNDYTINELVDFLDNYLVSGSNKYRAETSYFNATNESANVMDFYDDIEILDLPLIMKKANLEISTAVNEQSTLLNLEKVVNVYGQIKTNSSKIFLTGGTRGLTSNTSIQAGFDALLSTRVNIVVPLFSRNASADISEGLTDPLSTYTIASIHSITDTHCRTASNVKNKNERNGYLAIKDSFANSRTASKNLNSQFVSMVLQDPTRVNVFGDSKVMQPHILAAACAGIQAGSSIGTDLTYKYLNIDGLDHTDYRADNLGDIENAIIDGLLVVERPASGGFRIVAGNTTWTADENFAYNRIGTFEAGQFVAYDLRAYLENIFVGENITGGRFYKLTTAGQIANAAKGRLEFYNAQGYIVGDDQNDNLGWSDLTVIIEGTTATLEVCVTPTQGISFIVPKITLKNIRQIA